ncbi:MAG: ROK family protein, partial [Marinilabiliaceae bacterium]
MKKVAIGIDIGGTNTVIGAVDQDGNVMISRTTDTAKHGDFDSYIVDVATEIKELEKSLKLMNEEIDILGIGVGAPNGNYYNGTIEFAPNLSFKGVVHVVDALKKEFPESYAIALTNDANAAAIGEMVYGGAHGMQNFVMFTLGTGVGSGVIVNGDLVYGHDGFAGECGHTTLIPGGRLCGCGAKGHLEAYCSAPGMKRTAFELIAYYNAEDSILAGQSYKDMTSKTIYEAAEKGDKI